jgi:hypothetical protein
MTFCWNGRELGYFDHRYNHTALNSRRVEVPIARWFLTRAGEKARILEVGNVLAHYGPINWPVVDLRERGAINADVMGWQPHSELDLVVSISTIEHIQARPSQVLARLRSFLAPGGIALVTAPTGYRADLDRELREGMLPANRAWFMRAYPGGGWQECTMAAALAMPPRACSGRWSGGVMILVCKRPREG